MKKVRLAAPISDTLKQFLISKGYELIDKEDKDVQGIITSNKLMLDEHTLSSLPQLKWIARIGSGMEIIDTGYCDKHQIKYFSSPNGIANAVAEHTMGMLLSLLHKIPKSFEEIKNRQWNREENRGRELQNLTVGIIGYGHTGSSFAKKLSVFTKSILVYDKYKQKMEDTFVQEVTLAKLIVEADVISFHVPLAADTHHYFNEHMLNALKKNIILINTARGAVVDTQMLLKGLQNGQIFGACIDVLEEEKNIMNVLQMENNMIMELMKYNVIITPHIAGYSFEATEKMSAEIQSQIEHIV